MTPVETRTVWSRLLTLARWIERPVIWIGEAVSWLFLPLVGIILFDAISRRYLRKLDFVIENDLHFYFNSPALQDAEWHLHTIIFLWALGYAYACNAHVRLDMFRPKFGARGRLWIEFLGVLLLALPFFAVFTADAWDFFWSAWVHDEGYGESNGIGDRWIIKSFIFSGPVFLLMASTSMGIRLFVRLFGPPDLAKDTRTQAISQEAFSAFN